MNQTDVIAKLQTIFDDVFLEPVVLTPAISAKDVPEWDSLMHISLMVAVEKAFDVRFRVGEVENARNVGEFADLILKRHAGALDAARPFPPPGRRRLLLCYCWSCCCLPALLGKSMLPPREEIYSSIWWANGAFPYLDRADLRRKRRHRHRVHRLFAYLECASTRPTCSSS